MRTPSACPRLLPHVAGVLATGLVLCSCLPDARAAQASAAPPALDLARWEKDIAAFEAADRAHPVAPGGILFAGSSSIRLWGSLENDFAGLPVINRGFGGSQIREVTAFVPRIVLPYKPKLIVFYCGTNDIANGRPALQVADDFNAFVTTVRATLPETRIAFIGAAPNPARWGLRSQMLELNARVRALAATTPRLDLIDVWPAMLGSDGLPRPDIFIADRLHMNARGYEIWTRIVGAYLQAHPLAAGVPPGRDFVLGVRERIHSKALGEDRDLLVSMPQGIATRTNLRYPVLLVLDGDWNFAHTAIAAGHLASNGRVPPLIVVGVMNVDRSRDFLPTFVDGRLADGKPDRFLSFLTDEVIPFVDAKYPTAAYRAIAGHSHGGMYALYALVRRPGFFNAHLAMSPSYGLDDRFVAEVERTLAARDRLDAFVYVSTGDEEADVSVGATRLAKTLETAAPPGLTTRFEFFPGESHGSVVYKAVYRGLELLGFSDAVPQQGPVRFLGEAEAKRRAWAARFGPEAVGARGASSKPSVAAFLLDVLDRGERASLGPAFDGLRTTEAAGFRFDDIELANLAGWLRSVGRADDATAVDGLRSARTADARINEYGTAVDLARGLVARYPLDGNAVDATGTAPSGTLQSAVAVEDRAGRPAHALHFDGAKARVEVPSDPRLADGRSITVSAWIRPTALTAYAAWISKTGPSWGSEWRIGLASKPDQQWGLTVFTDRWRDYWGATVHPAANRWTHVTVVADQTTGRLQYYVDGTAAGSSAGLVPFLPGTGPMYIGFQRDDGVYFTGDVDDVRLWNRALGAAEVAALFKETP